MKINKVYFVRVKSCYMHKKNQQKLRSLWRLKCSDSRVESYRQHSKNRINNLLHRGINGSLSVCFGPRGFTSCLPDSGASSLSDCGSPRASDAPVVAETSSLSAPGGRSVPRGSGEPIRELRLLRFLRLDHAFEMLDTYTCTEVSSDPSHRIWAVGVCVPAGSSRRTAAGTGHSRCCCPAEEPCSWSSSCCPAWTVEASPYGPPTPPAGS